jgi:IS1 family transposase
MPPSAPPKPSKARKKNLRWLRYAIDAATGCILTFAFGRRKEDVCEQLITNLRVFDIRTDDTDDGPRYAAFIPANKHVIGKNYT